MKSDIQEILRTSTIHCIIYLNILGSGKVGSLQMDFLDQAFVRPPPKLGIRGTPLGCSNKIFTNSRIFQASFNGTL
jgi:hypothetical protein